MPASLTGDFAGLRKIVAKLEAMKKAVPKTAELGAEAIAPIVAKTISAGTDAYGRPWAPLVGGGSAGAGLDGGAAKVRGTKTSVVASVTRRVPRFFNRGRTSSIAKYKRGGHMPPRQLIPEGNAIPVDWLRALDDSAQKALGPEAVLVAHTQAKAAAQVAAKQAQVHKRVVLKAARAAHAEARAEKSIAKYKRDVAKLARKGG